VLLQVNCKYENTILKLTDQTNQQQLKGLVHNTTTSITYT